MAQKYTPEQFIKWLHTFPANIQNYTKLVWNQQTEEIKGDAQQRTPLVTGNLQDSAAVTKAVIGKNGITSNIIFRAPYAINIETGQRNGKSISLRPVGYKYPHNTKSRLGEIGFLSNAAKDGADGLVEAVKDAIDKAWNKG